MSLAIADAHKRFGGIAALDGVSLALTPGVLAGLIGPNGSGKTTLFNVVAGIHRLDAGSVRFNDARIDGLAPHRIVRLGLARTFQTTRLFPTLTVAQNVMLAAQSASGKRDRTRALAELARVGMAAYADEPAEGLSFGQARLVEFARTLMSDPKLVLFDEPFAGLAPGILAELAGFIRTLHARGVTVLLIEHNLEVAMDLCQHFYVMDRGRLIAEGSPAAVRRDPRVVDAYLGTAE
jgi:branched-chain amino acid transport system ATP-binding protein